MFAKHGEYNAGDATADSLPLSHKFQAEPVKYFQDKVLSALLERALREVTVELQEAVDSYAKKIVEEPLEMDSVRGDSATSRTTLVDTSR